MTNPSNLLRLLSGVTDALTKRYNYFYKGPKIGVKGMFLAVFQAYIENISISLYFVAFNDFLYRRRRHHRVRGFSDSGP
jgi:hypothetical protein